MSRPTKIELRGYMSDKRDKELAVKHPSGKTLKIILKSYGKDNIGKFMGSNGSIIVLDNGEILIGDYNLSSRATFITDEDGSAYNVTEELHEKMKELVSGVEFDLNEPLLDDDEVVKQTSDFAKKLIKGQEPVDLEIEKFFNDNFWDILASEDDEFTSDWDSTLLDGLDGEEE